MESKDATNEITRYNNEELRIVMVGKTGIGKSATGNTILGTKHFESKFSPKSMTVDCAKARAVVDGQKVVVIDTPGLFDTRFSLNKTVKDMAQCVSYASPGPHVFLIVIKLGRYTEEEKQTVKKIQEVFGEDANKYSMVLFTHGDLLDGSIEEFLRESEDLQELVDQCDGQYHVFNNKLKDGSQVTELLKKIKFMTEKNGESHYTNEMFQETERKIEEEKLQILKQKEEQMRKEREEMEKKLEEKYQEEIRKIKELQAEREREREEREEERERERERKEREEERKRERKEREEEMKREREARQKEREAKERETAETLKQLEAEHERQLREKNQEFERKHEQEAREEAEKKNPIAKFGQRFLKAVKRCFKWRGTAQEEE